MTESEGQLKIIFEVNEAPALWLILNQLLYSLLIVFYHEVLTFLQRLTVSRELVIYFLVIFIVQRLVAEDRVLCLLGHLLIKAGDLHQLPLKVLIVRYSLQDLLILQAII